MTNILFIDEDYFRSNTYLNNVWGEAVLPAVRDAQEMMLQPTIGSCLYNKLIQLIKSGEIADSDNFKYKELLDDYIRPFLLYATQYQLIPLLSTKIGNLGTIVSNDQYVVNLSQPERELVENDFLYKSDFYKKRMQEYLLNNKSSFPELEQCVCDGIRRNLTSSNSCSFWLGGYRGYHLN